VPSKAINLDQMIAEDTICPDGQHQPIDRKKLTDCQPMRCTTCYAQLCEDCLQVTTNGQMWCDPCAWANDEVCNAAWESEQMHRKSFSIVDKTKVGDRSGTRWDADEDFLLIRQHRAGQSLGDIAASHCRSALAIWQRLYKLRAVTLDEVPTVIRDYFPPSCSH
jgi:hypothetical protein